MDRRQKLQNLLKSILGSDNVYFQPPPSVKLKYPCIIYNRKDISQTKADNIDYIRRVLYNLILVGYDPNSEIIDKLLDIPYCSYDRFYTADDLNHDVFSLYY
jgi:hypothetical protein